MNSKSTDIRYLASFITKNSRNVTFNDIFCWGAP